MLFQKIKAPMSSQLLFLREKEWHDYDRRIVRRVVAATRTNYKRQYFDRQYDDLNRVYLKKKKNEVMRNSGD